MSFCHYRIQSSYSLLESTLRVKEIIDIAKEYNMPAIALTDRDNLFGSLEFANLAIENNIQPIHGVIQNISFININNNKEKFVDSAEILIIAKNKVGFQNLLKLNSKLYIKDSNNISENKHQNNDKFQEYIKEEIIPNRLLDLLNINNIFSLFLNEKESKIENNNLYITLEDLIEYQEGLIILSAYEKGIIGKCLLNNNKDLAKEYGNLFKNIFSDRYYLEISRHNNKNEILIENSYIKLAEKLSLPLIATNNILFKSATDYDNHDSLICIATARVKEDIDRKRVSNNCYFRSQYQMKELFSDLPDAIENAENLYLRCSYHTEDQKPMLPQFSKDENSTLKKVALKGLNLRLEKKISSLK
ncbi:MAG TPA: PHP domain-containing protein, partial [Candidatus Megaira endosymbiont of Hartmannula sinica]|nr:PHP domain-containing protein [Candidatus Megaera endosymbiont of Hartmannula sinica]